MHRDRIEAYRAKFATIALLKMRELRSRPLADEDKVTIALRLEAWRQCLGEPVAPVQPRLPRCLDVASQKVLVARPEDTCWLGDTLPETCD